MSNEATAPHTEPGSDEGPTEAPAETSLSMATKKRRTTAGVVNAPKVEGPVAGESTTGPATQDEAAEPHCRGGPAGESTGPAAWLSPPSDTQQLDYVPLSDVGVGDRVKVWSHSSRAWVPAVVSRVHSDGELVVAYRDAYGREREKDLPRDDSELRQFLPGPGGG